MRRTHVSIIFETVSTRWDGSHLVHILTPHKNLKLYSFNPNIANMPTIIFWLSIFNLDTVESSDLTLFHSKHLKYLFYSNFRFHKTNLSSASWHRQRGVHKPTASGGGVGSQRKIRQQHQTVDCSAFGASRRMPEVLPILEQVPPLCSRPHWRGHLQGGFWRPPDDDVQRQLLCNWRCQWKKSGQSLWNIRTVVVHKCFLICTLDSG